MSRVIPIALLALSTLALPQQATPPPQPLSIDGAATHVYRSVGGVEPRLHVFAPAGAAAAPRPAIRTA